MRFIIFLLLLSTTAAAQELLADPPYIKQEMFKADKIITPYYPGDQSFDVQFYHINLQVHTSPNFISAYTSVTGKIMDDIAPTIFLDLSSALAVDSVLSDGISLNYIHENDKLLLSLERIYFKNELFTVTVYYSGLPPQTGLDGFVFSQRGDIPLIWTITEPYRVKDWFPCKDDPSDKVDSVFVYVRCNTNLIPVSNGVLKEIIVDRDDTHIYKWEHRYPVAHYLISVAITNYTVYSQNYIHPAGSMPVVHYVYPEALETLKPQLDKTIPMLSLFSSLFGEYPFIREKYGHAQCNFPGGMENQTISAIGIFSDDVIAHEIGHQWFGNKVTTADWHHIWLNEGFATFTELTWAEAAGGKELYYEKLDRHIARAKQAVGSVYVRNIESVAEIFSGVRSYSKGGVILHMLRGLLGDSLFYLTLREYVNDPQLAYGAVITEDFQRVAESVTGTDLKYFFDQWIYGENYPRYTIKWDYEEDGAFSKIKVNVAQNNNSYPHYFTMPLQFRVITVSSDTLITLFNNQQEQDFEFNVKGSPVGFYFDPDKFILKEVLLLDPKDFTKPEHFMLRQNYPNPFNNGTIISYLIPPVVKGSVFIEIEVFDPLGKKVASLVNQEKEAGYHETVFNPHELGSGTYYYRLKNFPDQTIKMIYIK